MPLRIAYLINQYPKVSHSFIRREIRALEDDGIEVVRIALRGWDGELVDDEDFDERARTRYVLSEGGWPLISATLRVAVRRPRRWLAAVRLAARMATRSERPILVHMIYLAEACRVLEWLEAAGVRHLHAHFGTNPAEIAMLARTLGGPTYSFTAHGPEEFDKPGALHLAEKVRRSAFVVAVSSFGASQLCRWVEFEYWPRIKVVHCGLERGFFKDIPMETPGSRRLVCVGRLCEQKGQLLLVMAAAELARRGRDFELVLAGDGEMRAHIEDLVAESGLAPHVRITGWISSERVRQEILAARAMVLPSFAEGLPVVIMEAMALRRPVLSTYVAGIPELVRPGETGWLVPAGDLEALVDALDTVLSVPPEQLSSMGRAARERALERHSIHTEARKLAVLFREAAAVG